MEVYFMKSENIVLEIFDGIEKAINKGYTRCM